MTVLVHHYRHVIAGTAEILQQHIEPLALRHHGGRTDPVLDVELTIRIQGQLQEILGMENAFHIIQVISHHRESGVLGFHHFLQNRLFRLIVVQAGHLSPGNHDVPGLHVGNLQGTEDDVQLIAVHELPVGRITQRLPQLDPVSRLAGK